MNVNQYSRSDQKEKYVFDFKEYGFEAFNKIEYPQLYSFI